MGSAPNPLVGQSTAHAHTFFSKEWKVLQLNFSQGLNIQGKTIESQPAGTEKKEASAPSQSPARSPKVV
jgi:hypothetical protein